jgi:lauroyl/myristoyl acyltransferase
MPAEAPSIDCQQLFRQLIEEPVTARLLALTPDSCLRELAEQMAAEDLYHFASVTRAAATMLNLTGDADQFVRDHIEHQLWVHKRRALWLSKRIQSEHGVGLGWHIEGEENFRATQGRPTILISPMMIPYEDALWISSRMLSPREVAIYGEGLAPDEVHGQIQKIFGLESIRLVDNPLTILRVLHKGGVFLTYPDFVYQDHLAHHVQFFGMRWPMSSGFISICSQPGILLTPACLERQANEVVIHVGEPVEVHLPEGPPDKRWTHHLVGAAIARMLEEMVLRNPAQWQLLPTLIAHCSQRAT